MWVIISLLTLNLYFFLSIFSSFSFEFAGHSERILSIITLIFLSQFIFCSRFSRWICFWNNFQSKRFDTMDRETQCLITILPNQMCTTTKKLHYYYRRQMIENEFDSNDRLHSISFWIDHHLFVALRLFLIHLKRMCNNRNYNTMKKRKITMQWIFTSRSYMNVRSQTKETDNNNNKKMILEIEWCTDKVNGSLAEPNIPYGPYGNL